MQVRLAWELATAFAIAASLFRPKAASVTGAADAATGQRQMHPFLGTTVAAMDRWQAKSREQG